MTGRLRRLGRSARPYVALGRPVRAAARGHRVLGARVWVWIMAGEQWNKLWRGVGLALCLGTLYRAAEQQPMLMIPVSVAWAVAVLRCAVRVKVEQTPGEEPTVPPLTAAELAAAMHTIGAPHAHLAVLASHLKTTPARVREGCALAGVPVAGGVRMEGRGVSTGVKAADFPPLPSPAVPPSGPVVVAGQPSNNNTEGVRVDRSREGMTIIHRLSERHRRHKVPRGH